MFAADVMCKQHTRTIPPGLSIVSPLVSRVLQAVLNEDAHHKTVSIVALGLQIQMKTVLKVHGTRIFTSLYMEEFDLE